MVKQVSLHGRRAYVNEHDQIGARNGFIAGGEGKPRITLPGSPETVAVFEDFLSKSVDGFGDTGSIAAHDGSGFFQVKTADTGRNATLQQNFTNGVIRLAGAGVATTPAASVIALVGHSAAWKVNMGPGGQSGRLHMIARIKAPGINNGLGTHDGSWNNNGIFVGFTDTGILATVEMPFYDTGDGQPTDTGQLHTGTVAKDLCGFFYGERADTGWRGISAKGTLTDSGDQEVLLTSTNPTANKWVTLEVDITRGISDTGGTATFSIDGVAVGKITSPVATDVPLTPVVAMIVTDTGVADLDVDYMGASGPRDSGT